MEPGKAEKTVVLRCQGRIFVPVKLKKGINEDHFKRLCQRLSQLDPYVFSKVLGILDETFLRNP